MPVFRIFVFMTPFIYAHIYIHLLTVVANTKDGILYTIYAPCFFSFNFPLCARITP